MRTIGVICEYNPLHLGHQYHLHRIKEKYGADSRIVCLMSGNYVQRGAPAIFDKMLRAEAAILSGADLVIELPLNVCLSSAEGYAFGGVSIASKICDVLSFGVESMTEESLFAAASAMETPAFSSALKEALAKGLSFPVAREKAFASLSKDLTFPVNPNDILGTEYCKAILRLQSDMKIFTVKRDGGYHSEIWDAKYPSASAVRRSILFGEDWYGAVPENTRFLFSGAEIHHLPFAERAIIYRLHTMNETDFEALPYGSEGLWRRFMHACHHGSDLEEIISLTKTKRYTRSRIDRMILCAFLGVTEKMLQSPAPYARILAFNEKGRTILRDKSDEASFINVGEKVNCPYWELEQRSTELYSLFSETITKSKKESENRVVYCRGIV